MSPRVVTFGRMPTDKPKHALAEIHFPELARLDQGTAEGMLSRVLTSDGGNSRALPRTISFQYADMPGHDGAVPVGSVYEVTLDGETGLLSGKGWLLDSEDGNKAALHVAGKALFHNSIDLSETKVELIEHGDFWDDDFQLEVRFVEWSFSKTTLVASPAFADAHAIVPDELTAAIEAGPLVCDAPSVFNFFDDSEAEVLASMTGVPPWAAFHVPEPDQHHAIRVGEPGENGWTQVTGHLSLWETCHDGYATCTRTPRPHDNYASFNRLTVLTDRGPVETGPISLMGGHVTLAKALDDVENAWCDVRIIPGRFGPWMSGVVRPGVPDDRVYAARASGVSGHWKGGRLRAIVSVNAEAYNVPGSGFSLTTDADGHIDELVASYPGCVKPADEVQAGLAIPAWMNSLDQSTPAEQRQFIKQWVKSQAMDSYTSAGNIRQTEPEPEPEPEFDVETERLRAEALLALEVDGA